MDVTIGYPEHKDMNLQTILFGTRNPCQTTVYFRKFPIMDVPLEGEALTKWLNDRFVEKEEMLDVFYKTGKFPTWNKETSEVKKESLEVARLIPMNNVYIILGNITYIVLLYLTWNFVKTILSFPWV